MKTSFKRTTAAILAALILASTGAATVAMTGVGASVVFADEDATTLTTETTGSEGNEKYTVANGVITINESGKYQLSGALNAQIIISENTVVTLDLNGQTLTNLANKDTVVNNGTLTIMDSGENGEIKGDAALHSALLNEPGATATIKSGKISKSNNTNSRDYYVITNHGTKLTIDGGAITSASSHSSAIENGWYTPSENTGKATSTLIINDATVDNTATKADGGLYTLKNDDYGIMEINGGTFGNTTSGAGTVLNWNELTINGGIFNATNAAVSTMSEGSSSDSKVPKYTFEKGKTIINDGTFYGSLGTHSNSSYQAITVSVVGGTFSTNPTAYKATSAYVHKNSDGYVVNSTPHSITVTPASQSIYVGNTVSFKAEADCDTVGTLQWQKKDSNGNYTNIDDETETSYTADALSTGSYTYRAVAGDIVSDDVTVKVSNYPTTTTTTPTVTTNEDGSTTTTTTKTEGNVTTSTATNKDADGNVTGSTETKEEKKSDGSTVTTETKKDADGKVTQKTETTVAKDTTTNTTTETTKTENADGTKTTETVKTVDENNNVLTETTKETEVDKEAEKQTEVLTEKKEDGSVVKTTTTSSTKEGDLSATIVEEKAAENSKGSTVEQTTITVVDTTGKTTSVTEEHKIDNVGNSTNATVTIEKDGDGNVQEATAEVEKTGATKENGVQATFTNKVVSQLKEAAGEAAQDLTITMTVKDENGDDHHSITAKVEDLTPNNTLYIYKQDENGNYVMVNAKAHYKQNIVFEIKIKPVKNSSE